MDDYGYGLTRNRRETETDMEYNVNRYLQEIRVNIDIVDDRKDDTSSRSSLSLVKAKQKEIYQKLGVSSKWL